MKPGNIELRNDKSWARLAVTLQKDKGGHWLVSAGRGFGSLFRCNPWPLMTYALGLTTNAAHRDAVLSILLVTVGFHILRLLCEKNGWPLSINLAIFVWSMTGGRFFWRVLVMVMLLLILLALTLPIFLFLKEILQPHYSKWNFSARGNMSWDVSM